MRSTVWKAIKAILIFLLVTAAVVVILRACNLLGVGAKAEDTAYVICSPDDVVNIRRSPSRKSESIGRFEACEMVTLDGKKRNGYLHCVGLGLEEDSGWIHSGYVVNDMPEFVGGTATIVSKGRLAARKYVKGKRTRWLKPLASVKVWYWSEEWAVTNCGYVQTKYLELDGG